MERELVLGQFFAKVRKIRNGNGYKFKNICKQLCAITDQAYDGPAKTPEWYWEVIEIRDRTLTVFLDAIESDSRFNSEDVVARLKAIENAAWNIKASKE